MKITIETTVSEPEFSHKSVYEVDRDELTATEVMFGVYYAMLGFTFDSGSILNAMRNIFVESGSSLGDQL